MMRSTINGLEQGESLQSVGKELGMEQKQTRHCSSLETGERGDIFLVPQAGILSELFLQRQRNIHVTKIYQVSNRTF